MIRQDLLIGRGDSSINYSLNIIPATCASVLHGACTSRRDIIPSVSAVYGGMKEPYHVSTAHLPRERGQLGELSSGPNVIC